jgi:hypothetical protein
MRSLFLSSALLCLATISNAATITFTASNPVTSADFSTEFATLPASGNLSDPQTFDGFFFDQVNGDANGIWTTYNPGGGDGKGWYPNGGDGGYTQIQLANSASIGAMSFFVGSGGNLSYLAYQLVYQGVVVQSGTLSGHTSVFHWLSISGGGFDTVRLRDGGNASITVGDGSLNALAFDKVFATTAAQQVNAAVPDAGSTFVMLGFALSGIAVLRRKLGVA